MSAENEQQPTEIENNENENPNTSSPQDQKNDESQIDESQNENEKNEPTNPPQLTIENPTTIIENEEVNNNEQKDDNNTETNENPVAVETNEASPSQEENNAETNENPVVVETNEALPTQDENNAETNENSVVVETNEASPSQEENNAETNENLKAVETNEALPSQEDPAVNTEIDQQNEINTEEAVETNNETDEINKDVTQDNQNDQENIQNETPIQTATENDQNLVDNENAGTCYQETGNEITQNDDIDIPIQYQGDSYSPNLANSQSISVDVPNEEMSETDSSSRRNSQSQRVAAPSEPIGNRKGSAPRPRSQRNKNAQQQNQEVRIENFDDDERPSSACSSYSYTYSYSETEEEIRRPIKHKKQLKDYLPNYLKEQLETMSAQQTQRSAMVSDEDIENLKRRAKNFQPLENYPNEVYEALLDSLMEERTEMATRENFKESEKLNKVIEHVSHCYLEQRKYDLQNETYNEMMDELDEVNEKLSLFDQESKRMEQQHKEESERLFKRMQERHDKDLDDMQNRWNEDDKLRQYNRASPRLVYLRKQFKLLMRQCKFQEAEDVKRMILALEKQEQDIATAAIQTSFQNAVTKVEMKQNEEMKFYQSKQDIKLKQIRMERKRLREALENRLRKVEDKRSVINDPDKLWNYNQSQKKKETTRSVRAIQPEMNLSRLTTNAFTEREDTTLHLPKLTLKRNSRMTAASSRK